MDRGDEMEVDLVLFWGVGVLVYVYGWEVFIMLEQMFFCGFLLDYVFKYEQEL